VQECVTATSSDQRDTQTCATSHPGLHAAVRRNPFCGDDVAPTGMECSVTLLTAQDVQNNSHDYLIRTGLESHK